MDNKAEVSGFASNMSRAVFFFTVIFISTCKIGLRRILFHVMCAEIYWCRIIFISDCSAQVTVTQSTSKSVSTGDTVTISCTVSGFSISDRYVYWFQQKEGNKPQYLLWYDNDSSKHQGTGVPDRISGSKDTSKNTGYLTIKQCVLDDDADYYCAMWHPSITTLHTVTRLWETRTHWGM